MSHSRNCSSHFWCTQKSETQLRFVPTIPDYFSIPSVTDRSRQLKFMIRVNGKICAHSRCLKLGSLGKIVRKLDKAKSHIFRICRPQTKQGPFSSSKNPYFQNGAKCETSLEKMAFISMKIRTKISKASHPPLL